MSNQMPTFDSLINPLLNALFDLGGSGSVNEIYEKVLELEAIDEKNIVTTQHPFKSRFSFPRSSVGMPSWPLQRRMALERLDLLPRRSVGARWGMAE